jgi:hypothetical protein
VLRAIRNGKARDVKTWASCLSTLAPAGRVRLLAGRDASGLPLLAQPWCDEHPVVFGKRQFVRPPERVAAQHDALAQHWYAPDDSDEDNAASVVATHPSALPALVKEALGAWFDLCEVLPAETQADLMAGCDAAGNPWWIVMTYRGDSHLIADVVSEMSTRLTGERRLRVVERLGAVSQEVPELLRKEMAEKTAPREQMAEALKAIGDWLPADLRAELHTILAQG